MVNLPEIPDKKIQVPRYDHVTDGYIKGEDDFSLWVYIASPIFLIIFIVGLGLILSEIFG